MEEAILEDLAFPSRPQGKPDSTGRSRMSEYNMNNL